METMEAGQLRRLLSMCKACCEKGEPSSSTALAGLPQNQAQFLGLDLGPKLDAGKLKQLWDDFNKNYPSEQLESESRPCKQLVQQVFTQHHQKDLRFIPWKQVVSEVQADNAKLAQGTKEKSFLALLAEASGQQDALEVDPSPYLEVARRVLGFGRVVPPWVGQQALAEVAFTLRGAQSWCHGAAGTESGRGGSGRCRAVPAAQPAHVNRRLSGQGYPRGRDGAQLLAHVASAPCHQCGRQEGQREGEGQSPLCPCFQGRRQGRWQARIRTARQTGQVPCIPEGQVPARELQVCARVRSDPLGTCAPCHTC